MKNMEKHEKIVKSEVILERFYSTPTGIRMFSKNWFPKKLLFLLIATSCFIVFNLVKPGVY